MAAICDPAGVILVYLRKDFARMAVNSTATLSEKDRSKISSLTECKGRFTI